MGLLRQFRRRKVRTTLTIVGIVIGIWSLVVFSAMANKIDSLVAGGSDFYAGKVVVTDGGAGGLATQPMRATDGARIAALPGVAAVVPQAMLFTDEDLRVSFGVPSQIIGTTPGADAGHETFRLDYAQGRALTPADEGSANIVLGSDISRKLDAGIGSTVQLHGHPFQVVGILAPTLTTPDNNVTMTLSSAQALLHEDLPSVIRDTVRPEDVVSQYLVYPDDGVDPTTVAAGITKALPGVATMTGADYDQQIGSTVGLFNAIIVGIAFISLVVGGLSVINTMAMSVAERTREIGIKRAIGGSRRRIIRELITEAGAIGLIGGLVGLALGVALVVVANEAGRASGTVLFEMRTSTAVFAVAFATILGTIAGLVPAWNASRLDPVDALRYE